MRKKLQFTISLCALFLILNFLIPVIAQEPPPPPPPSHGEGGNVPGGGAPVGSGIELLLLMGVGYGIKKVFDARRKLID